MIITGDYNPSQHWFRTVAHGILTWATRGVHLGYDRSYFSVDLDDVLLPDSRWSDTGKCTPGDDFCTAAESDIRMTPADVDKLVAWQSTNNFKLSLLFNGGGSDAYAADNGSDPLATALTAPGTASNFDWVNHTYSHPFLGCIQVPPTATAAWQCATTANTPTAPLNSTLSGGVYYVNQATINAEIQQNITWATSHGLPNFKASELVSGEHSGLLTTPQQPVDNPNFVSSLKSFGIAYTGSDASREPAQRTLSSGVTKTVPRHPMNIYYNVGTYQDEVSEYNWIYTAAPGGSGICTANPATSTCITPLLYSDDTVAKTSFDAVIKPLEVRIALTHVLNNDPSPHYAHQSNIAEDGVLYPVIEGVLASYRAEFAANAPIVTPTMTQSGAQLARAAAWTSAKNSTTAYLDGTGVHVTAASGTQVPVTVPTGSTGGSLDPVADAYAGELSRWNTGSFDITVPDVGYGTAPPAPTLVNGVAGDAKVTLSWLAPVVPAGAPAIASYIVTPYVGTVAQAPVPTPTAAVTFDVTGLTNGTAYTFTVAAKNAKGFVGAPSLPSAAVTPVGKPGAPTGVTGTAGDQRVTLSWTAPATNGGSPVTGYVLTPYVGSAAQTALIKTVPVTSTTGVDVTGLTNGTTYTFTVAAINSVGTGPESAASGALKPLGNPGAPSALTGTAGDKQVILSWTAPIDTGGSAVTRYEIVPSIASQQQQPPPITTPTSATSYAVKDLTNGTTYTFTVAAITEKGTGAQSASSSELMPVARPDAPTAASAVAGNRSAQLTWKAPADNGGKPITSYVITPYIGASAGSPVTTGSAGTGVTVTGLANGTAYTFTVAAINAVGTGAPSGASNPVTPSAAPSVSVVKLNPVTLASSVTYRWKAVTNGSAITRYQVYVRRAAFGKPLPSTWNLLTTVTASTAKVTFGPGETVAIAVKAVDQASNSAQMSGASTPVSLPLGVASMVKSKGQTSEEQVDREDDVEHAGCQRKDG